MASVGTLSINVVANTARFNAGLQSASRQVGVFSASVGKSLRVLTPFSSMFGAGLVFGGAFALIGAGKAANEFAGEMNRSLAIMQNVGPQMRSEMEATARSVAASTQFTSREVARSFFFLASAGLDAERSIKSLRQVAFFGQAGNFDLATATDLATDAQSAMGLASKDAARHHKNLVMVTDQLTRANTISNASIQQFSESLTGGAGASSRILNVSMAETLAVLSEFARQGIKGADASTKFSIVLRDMSTKIFRNREAFEALNLEVFRMGEFVGPIEFFKQLERATQDMTGEELKKALLSLGLTIKTIGATEMLLGGADRMLEDFEKIKNGSISAKDVAEASLTDFDKAWNRITATMSTASTSAFTPILQQLAEMSGALDSGSSSTEQMVEATKKLSAQWERVGDTIATVIQQQKDLRTIFNAPQRIAIATGATFAKLGPDFSFDDAIQSLREQKQAMIDELLGAPKLVGGISEEQHRLQRLPSALLSDVQQERDVEAKAMARAAEETAANLVEARALFDGTEKNLGRQGEEWADSMMRARRMVISNQTPLEKYKSTLMDIKSLADKMPADFLPTAKRELAQAELEFKAEVKQQELTPGLTPALEAGSVAAAEAIARAMQTSFPASSIDQTAKNTAMIATQTRLSAQLLTELNRKQDKPGTVETATP